MPIILRLDRMMADRKISLNDLSDRIGIANVNLSKIKTGKVSAIRFSTLEAICDVLDCQPGDILEFKRIGSDKKYGVKNTVLPRFAAHRNAISGKYRHFQYKS